LDEISDLQIIVRSQPESSPDHAAVASCRIEGPARKGVIRAVSLGIISDFSKKRVDDEFFASLLAARLLIEPLKLEVFALDLLKLEASIGTIRTVSGGRWSREQPIGHLPAEAF
jgi:hypothetical protein